MALNAPASSNVETTANNVAATYVTPAFRANNANIANGSTFRITVGGMSTPGYTGSSDFPDQTYPAGHIFSVVMGANGNVADAVIFSTAEQSTNVNASFLKQFYIVVRNLGANGNVMVITTPTSTSNLAVTRSLSPNVNLTANLMLGLTYQSIDSANQSDYIEVAIVEQIV